MPTALAHRGPTTLRLAKRFFWKECRRIGVLAALMFVFATLTMLFVNSFASRRLDVDSLLAVIAVGAGMMLAVAAAATLFSVEKEEGTAELLERLPRNAAAMTLGKLASAAIVVPLCTVALLLLAWTIAGEAPPPQRIIEIALPQASLLLLEAFVWSLVASLACANPLIAAVLGIALASVSVQLGIFITNPEARGYAPAIFTAATPARFALAGVGALIAGWLVSRWPTPPRVRHNSEANIDEPRRRYLRWPRQRMGLFGRLFWQTLRQSCTTSVVAMLLGLFLTIMAVIMAAGIFESTSGWNLLVGLSVLFAPAMLGAVVFRADQRREAYRFLAEHAGRPRMLWLARSAAGLAMLAALLALALTVTGLWIGSDITSAMKNGWYNDASPGVVMLRVSNELGVLRQILVIAGIAAVVAYAFGQFFSLAVRSDVIAAMLALIASIIVTAWAAVVGAWQLPPSAFLLPLAIGALLASLLRVRDWMFGRRGWWRWAAPIVVLLAPLMWLAWATPVVRLAQVDRPKPYIRPGGLVVLNPKVEAAAIPPSVGSWVFNHASRFDELVNQTQEELRLGEEVAAGYEKLTAEAVDYELIDPDAVSDDEATFGTERDANGKLLSVHVARPAGDRFDGEAFEEFVRLSRIKCRLEVNPSTLRDTGVLQAIALMDAPESEDPVDLEERLERLLACRRMATQKANSHTLYQESYEAFLSDEFMDWATAEGQTSTRIGKAIRGLREAESKSIGPIGRLMNNHSQAKAIINGDAPPDFFAGNDAQPSIDQWLAYLANESLGFERQRALKALDLLAAYEAAFLGEGMQALVSDKPSQQWIQYYSIDDAHLVAALPYEAQRRVVSYLDDLDALASARSSGLTSLVFDNRHQLPDALRNWMAGVAWRRAERVRLALIAYRLEHDEYPTSLDALVGVFLGSEEIRDPYTGEPFGWAPKGFELPVSYFNEEPAEFVKSSAPAGTPMLWCGGSALAVPTERNARPGKPDEYGDEAEEGPVIKVMSLQPVEELIFWPTGAFWLPVPK
jgi:hypothetical protein